MRTLHLFAGIGGGLLADLILGHEPVCAVEIDPYCCAVLRDRRGEGWFPDLHVHEGDVRLWDPSPWAGGVDCIAAGFPCQDPLVEPLRLDPLAVVDRIRLVQPQPESAAERAGGPSINPAPPAR